LNWHAVDHPDRIRTFCLRDPGRYLFHLGDLDPGEWGHSDFLAFGDPAEPRALVLIYRGLSRPCVIAFGDEGALGDSFESLQTHLPTDAFFHGFDADLRRLESTWRVHRRGLFRRMLWVGWPLAAARAGSERCERLGPADLTALQALYADSYPESHFEAVHLEKSILFGLREGADLVAVSGLHVLSVAEGVAMLGNIATRRDRRGRGLGREVTAALLQELERWGIRHVGLNVHTDNEAARRLYLGLGFEETLLYEEAEYEA
jgi:ribosomal protein S18 acetylase RimI-like enzyme